MRRNLFNLIFVLGLLVLVTACFCRSDRETDGPDDNPGSEIETEEPANKRSKSTKASEPAAGKKRDEGDFLVDHSEVSTARYAEIDRQIKEEKILEKAADKLNRALILPRDITLRTKDCQQINAFYDPNDTSVTMCYELMEHFYAAFKSTGLSDQAAYDKMFEAVQFVFLHEIGHALIDVLKLPVTANEEDAADRLSSYVNLKEMGDEGVRAVFAAADAFAIESKQSAGSQKNMADEHLLGEQRFYNSLCMIYGSDPDKWSNIVTEGYLPKARADRCPGEYQRTVDSWINLLSTWRKN